MATDVVKLTNISKNQAYSDSNNPTIDPNLQIPYTSDQIAPRSINEIGYVRLDPDEPIIIICKDGDRIKNPIRDVEHWAYCLSDPWQGVSYSYEIYPIPDRIKSDLKFVCEYHVLVYDDIDVGLWAYGIREEDALKNCKALCDQVIEQYSPKVKLK